MAKKQTAEKKPRAKQGFLPEMEPPSIPAIDNAADNYVEARDARMNMLKRELDLRDILEAEMKKAKLKVYEYDGKTVSLEAQEKIKVRTKKEENENGVED